MAEIRITGLLADALLHSFETGSKRRLDLNATPYVVDSLTNRGLVECDLGLTRENGYETHVLTPRGMAAREDLIRSNWGPNPKSFDTDDLDREPESAVEYSVKIWYRSGAYEGAPHCPEELARKIYADSVKSSGVEFAELHGPSGMLVESKTPNEESPVTTEPEQPTENLFLAGLPLMHPEPLPPAPELPQGPEPTA